MNIANKSTVARRYTGPDNTIIPPIHSFFYISTPFFWLSLDVLFFGAISASNVLNSVLSQIFNIFLKYIHKCYSQHIFGKILTIQTTNYKIIKSWWNFFTIFRIFVTIFDFYFTIFSFSKTSDQSTTFPKNLRLGMFLASFFFFGYFSLDVLIKEVLMKKKECNGNDFSLFHILVIAEVNP